MELGTAKVLAIIATIVLIVRAALAVGLCGFYLGMLIYLLIVDGGPSDAIIIICIFGFFLLIYAGGFGFCIYVQIARVLRPILKKDFSNPNHFKFLIAALIVGFFVGSGWIVTIMNIILAASWSSFAQPPIPPYRPMPYGYPYPYQYPPGYPTPPGYPDFGRPPVMGSPPIK